jgi:hypothetical protein
MFIEKICQKEELLCKLPSYITKISIDAIIEPIPLLIRMSTKLGQGRLSPYKLS